MELIRALHYSSKDSLRSSSPVEMETSTEPVDPLSANVTALATQPEGKRIEMMQEKHGMHLFFSGCVQPCVVEVCTCAKLVL